MGIFRRRPEHDAGVIYVFERHADVTPYYSAVCRCGWYAEPVEVAYPDLSVQTQMATAARTHDPNAIPGVAFPLDEPPEQL